MHHSHASTELRELIVFIGMTLPQPPKKISRMRFKFEPYFGGWKW